MLKLEFGKAGNKMAKIVALNELRKIRTRYASKKVVFFSGAFDLIHYAHLKALKTASSYGDILVVQIDGNSLVQKRKGNDRPLIDEAERAEIISSLKFVNHVFISNIPSEDNRILNVVKPNIFIRAILADQTEAERTKREKILMKKIPNGRIVWLKQSPEISTTKILKLIKGSKNNYKNQSNESVSIGIAAYNAQNNIKQLVQSLLSQNKIEIVKEIVIHSDASQDRTVEFARQTKNPLIKIIDSKVRKGFALSVETLLKNTKSKVVILLNDDIQITDFNFLEKIITPFSFESKIGLVSGNPQPLTPKTFVEGAVISSFKAYEAMRNNLRDGHNLFTCDGKVLVLSRDFIKTLDFSESKKGIGNVDTFLYFSCLSHGFKYRHVKEARVHYRCPANLKDYLSQTARNNAQFFLLKNQFGSLLEEEFKLPKAIYKYYLREFFENPLGCIFIFAARFLLKIKTRTFEKWLSNTWEVVGSTKKLSEVRHV